MSGFRRFYSPGLEHILYLEELQRQASRSGTAAMPPLVDTTAMRRKLALVLVALAERIDPVSMPPGGKAKEAAP